MRSHGVNSKLFVGLGCSDGVWKIVLLVDGANVLQEGEVTAFIPSIFKVRMLFLSLFPLGKSTADDSVNLRLQTVDLGVLFTSSAQFLERGVGNHIHFNYCSTNPMLFVYRLNFRIFPI